MKYTRATAFAALGLAAALSLTACSGDDSEKDSSAKSDSSTSAPDSPKGKPTSEGEPTDDGSSSSGGPEAGGETSGGESGDDSGDGSDAGTQEIKSCDTPNLQMSARDDMPDPLNGNVTVTMTNKSSAACSVTGFPKVALTDADHTTSPLERDDNQPRVANLKPGQSAVFNISYEIPEGGKPGESNPTEIQVTPPHAKSYATLEWPSGTMKGMSNATARIHPIHANPMQ